MNNFYKLDKKIQMLKNSLVFNKPLIIVLLYITAFLIVFNNSIDDVSGSIDQNNITNNSTQTPNMTSPENNYCNYQSCEMICEDLKQAFVNGDGEKLKSITDRYPGSGDYCGY
ncbi:MAG: hypothetical protein H0X03_04725 [Nitrosopumilus sp.]|nr:hypothetical protein [Nitrosopumilus sp.]